MQVKKDNPNALLKFQFRCDCAITTALDILGDRWVLVVIKQMLIENAETFKDFLAKDEAIASNILSAKLKLLEQVGLVTKSKKPGNKKSNYYHLTEKALALTPIIVEMALWSYLHLNEHNTIGNQDILSYIKNNKEAYCNTLILEYRKKVTIQSSG